MDFKKSPQYMNTPKDSLLAGGVKVKGKRGEEAEEK